jgi:hypothetical protein
MLVRITLLLASLVATTGLHIRGPFQAEEKMDVDPAAMSGDPNALTDDQLHLSHGSLTPAKLTEMKEEMKTLQKSLGTLMDRQTALSTQYKLEKERAVEDKALKKKVREEVARSLLKNLDEETKSRNDQMHSIVDLAMQTTKDKLGGGSDKVDATGGDEDATGGEEGAATGAAQ